MPQRRPSGSGTQTLKFAPDIFTTFQPSAFIRRIAAVHSRMMSKGWVCGREVGDVGVGVVADHVAVADRAEQAAVHQVGVQAALDGQVVHDLLQRVHDLVAGGVLGVAEVALQPAALVDRERVALGVDHADPALAPPEPDGLGVQHVAAHVVDELDVGDALEVVHQGLGPGHLAGVVGAGPAVAVGVERPDPLPVEEHVDGARAGTGNDQTPGVDVDTACHWSLL